MNLFIIITAIITIGITYITVTSSIRKRITVKALRFAEDGQKDMYRQLMESSFTRKILTPFNYQYLKTFNAIRNGERKEVIDQFARFDQMELDEKQRKYIDRFAMKHFVEAKDRHNAEKYYDRLMEYKDLKDREEIINEYKKLG